MHISSNALPPFYGIFAATTTPFSRWQINYDAFTDHLLFLKTQGIQGVIPCGTTGEAIALTSEERGELIQTAVAHKAEHFRVIPGCGAPLLQEAITQVQQAQELGADAVLIITPYYVKPDQAALIHYYQNLHDASDLPILLYNNPARTGVSLSLEALESLVKLPRICGIKEALADFERISQIRTQLEPPFSILSGDDSTFSALLGCGGDGIISVGANAAPKLFLDFWNAWKDGDHTTLDLLRAPLLRLSRALSSGPNPAVIKYLCAKLGWGNGSLRVPISLPPQETQAQLDPIVQEIQAYAQATPKEGNVSHS